MRLSFTCEDGSVIRLTVKTARSEADGESRTMSIVVTVPDETTQVLPVEVKVATQDGSVNGLETGEASDADDGSLSSDDDNNDENAEGGLGDRDRDDDVSTVDHAFWPIDTRHEEVYNLYRAHLSIAWPDVLHISGGAISGGAISGGAISAGAASAGAISGGVRSGESDTLAHIVWVLARFDGMVGDNSIATFIHDINGDGRFKEAAAYYTAQQHLEVIHNLVLAKLSESLTGSGALAGATTAAAVGMAYWVHRHTDPTVYSFPHRFVAMAVAKGIMRGALLNYAHSLRTRVGRKADVKKVNGQSLPSPLRGEGGDVIERILTETNIHVYAATVIYQMMAKYHDMTRMKQENFAAIVKEATSLTETLLSSLPSDDYTVDLHIIANKVCTLFGYSFVFRDEQRSKSGARPFIVHVQPFEETAVRTTRREDAVTGGDTGGGVAATGSRALASEAFVVDLQRSY